MNENEPQAQLIKDLGAPLYEAKTWIRVLALMSVLSGVLLAIASIATPALLRPPVPGMILAAGIIVGLVFAYVLVFMGVQLYKSVAANEAARLAGQKEKLLDSLDHLATYFTIAGVLAIFGLLLELAALVVSALQ